MSIHAVCHGNLGRAAQARDIGKHRVVSFSMACEHGFGEKAVTTWVNVTLWGQVWGALVPRLEKGTEVIVAGELFERAYQAKDGKAGKSVELKATNIRIVTKSHGGTAATTTPSGEESEVPF